MEIVTNKSAHQRWSPYFPKADWSTSNEYNLLMNTIYLKVVDKSQTRLAYNIFPRFVREERWFGRYHFHSFQAIIDKEPRA